MCGDHGGNLMFELIHEGSPPHVRGPPVATLSDVVFGGITPACAGTTVGIHGSLSGFRDHPRMCGDHFMAKFLKSWMKGSPPHVRGPHGFYILYSNYIGITPACAGTTIIITFNRVFRRDHPRMCGDHQIEKEKEGIAKGSPPHVRGPR